MRPILTCALSAFAACLLFATAAQAREHYVIVDGLAGSPTRNSFFPDAFAHYSNALPKSVWIGAVHDWKGYSYYGGPGKISAKGFQARIGTGGKYGRANVTFRRAGYREEYRFGGGPCSGKKIVLELLVVSGRVRLDGETGFTSYDLASNKNRKKRAWYGTRLDFPSGETCGLSALFGGEPATIEDGIVELRATNEPAGVEFAIARETRIFGSLPQIGVLGLRNVDGALMQSGIAALNPTGRFRFGPELEWATVDPLLGSITGDATFTRIDESTYDWSGDLAVKLPGWPDVSMVGPGVDVTLAPYEGLWASDSEEGMSAATTASMAILAKGTPLRTTVDREAARLVRKANNAARRAR